MDEKNVEKLREYNKEYHQYYGSRIKGIENEAFNEINDLIDSIPNPIQYNRVTAGIKRDDTPESLIKCRAIKKFCMVSKNPFVSYKDELDNSESLCSITIDWSLDPNKDDLMENS